MVSRHGVRPGDRVGLAARNSANWIVAHMAILMAGGCATLLNGWWVGEELAGGVAIAGCRLVLADALWYCQDRFKPQFMIDLATLTGAMIIALGTDYAGVFSNNDELAERLGEAAKSASENLWRMPLPASARVNNGWLRPWTVRTR